MPNLRNSPAADISREFQTGMPPDVRSRPYISIEDINVSDSTTVSSGQYALVDILSSSGYIYEIINTSLFANSISGATSGTHEFKITSMGAFTVLFGSSRYNQRLNFNYSHWVEADYRALPPSDQLLAVQSCFADEDSPITISYGNVTDADQTNTRTIRFLTRKVRV